MTTLLTISGPTPEDLRKGAQAVRALAGALSRITFVTPGVTTAWPTMIAENVPGDLVDRLATALRIVMPPGVAVIVRSDTREEAKCPSTP